MPREATGAVAPQAESRLRIVGVASASRRCRLPRRATVSLERAAADARPTGDRSPCQTRSSCRLNSTRAGPGVRRSSPAAAGKRSGRSASRPRCCRSVSWRRAGFSTTATCTTTTTFRASTTRSRKPAGRRQRLGPRTCCWSGQTAGRARAINSPRLRPVRQQVEGERSDTVILAHLAKGNQQATLGVAATRLVGQHPGVHRRAGCRAPGARRQTQCRLLPRRRARCWSRPCSN